MSDTIIQAKNLTRKFGKLTAVDSISFSVNKGEIFGFLGPNGAGKTTAINMLCTIMKPTSGEAVIASYNVTREPNKIRQEIGIIFQDPSLDVRLTVEDNLRLHGYLYYLSGKEIDSRIKEVLSLVGLYQNKGDFVRKLSGGMKRRIEIARCLMHRPKILFLDEPTIGLDPHSRARIWEYILQMRKESGMTIFMTTHYIEESEICDRIAIIDRGKIVDIDTVANLKQRYNQQRIEGVFLKLTTAEADNDMREIDPPVNEVAIR